jgi:hypothetical protein
LFSAEHGIPNFKGLQEQVFRVKTLRDALYGHIPELSIQEQFNQYPIGETNFEQIMQELVEFYEKLNTLKL